ncbi:MAG: cytochrome d ubiquinol oxidase subunit II [Ktedonobacteraceae bacterium]
MEIMALPSLPYIIISVLWFALITYAVFGGADFGAGIWEIFATGAKAREQQELIDDALGPVWEVNHVWLVFLVVGLFSGFPGAFATLVAVLFFPITLALLGTVLRGSAFIFRTHGLRQTTGIWNRVFSFSSVITPFCLGAAAATVAEGNIQNFGPNAPTDLGNLWLTPFALTIGVLSLALCATIAAIFLTVEATNQKKADLAILFRSRGLIAGAVTAVLGALALFEASFQAPVLWQGMLNHAIPLVIATMIIGVGAALSLYFAYYRISRVLIIAEAAFMLGSWGVSQIPYIIPPKLTVDAAASSPSTQLLLLVGIIIGMIIILPSILLLFYIFKYKGGMPLLGKGPAGGTTI